MATVTVFSNTTTAPTLAGNDTLVVAEGVTLASDPGVTGPQNASAEFNILGNVISGDYDALQHMNAHTSELLVGAAGSLSSNYGQAAHISAATAVRINNQGSLSSSKFGAVLIQDADDSLTVEFVNSGQITALGNGYSAVAIYAGTGTVALDNSGTIQGLSRGLSIYEDTASLIVTNSGLISGYQSGLRINTTVLDLNNSGTIQSHSEAALHMGGGGTVVNSGLISAVTGEAIKALQSTIVQNSGTLIGTVNMSISDDLITNTGLIQGEVLLGNGNDIFNSKLGRTEGYVDGGDGDDTFRGSDLDDDFGGGDGWDVLRGRNGDDTLYGEDGEDQVYGGKGDDNLVGGADDDTLRGGKDDDVLNGGAGIDTLTGGRGEDTFVFGTGEAGTGADADVITDFTRKEDKINLQAFPGIALIGKAGFSGTASPEARLKSKKRDTLVLIDADGDGTADMQITVEGVNKLSAADFIL